MIEKEIQIVTFNNPYPPDFGGAIDLFYKIKALSELGVSIYLHIFYDYREDFSGLMPYCKTINAYKKNKFFIKHFSLLPYCVTSRLSKELVNNLNRSNATILFESIRTTGVLKSNLFKHKIAVRCHNIEHEYSWGLYRSEHNWLKKAAFLIEGYKLKYYETILNKAHILFPISYNEYSYFDKHFKNKSIFLPAFHGNKKLQVENGFGKYALYHGDLSTADNIKSAFFIINIFKDLKEKLIIASSTKNSKLLEEINKHKNISFSLVSSENELSELIKNAHINVLYSFQKSGTKLKVFNALYKGRHCILNNNMIDDPDILQLCKVAENEKDYKSAVRTLFIQEYILTEERVEALKKYDAKQNAEQIIKAIF